MFKQKKIEKKGKKNKVFLESEDSESEKDFTKGDILKGELGLDPVEKVADL
jgi:hypothetical protein